MPSRGRRRRSRLPSNSPSRDISRGKSGQPRWRTNSRPPPVVANPTTALATTNTGWRRWRRLVTAKGLADPAALVTRKEAWTEAYRSTPHGRPVELPQRRRDLMVGGFSLGSRPPWPRMGWFRRWAAIRRTAGRVRGECRPGHAAWDATCARARSSRRAVGPLDRRAQRSKSRVARRVLGDRSHADAAGSRHAPGGVARRDAGDGVRPSRVRRGADAGGVRLSRDLLVGQSGGEGADAFPFARSHIRIRVPSARGRSPGDRCLWVRSTVWRAVARSPRWSWPRFRRWAHASPTWRCLASVRRWAWLHCRGCLAGRSRALGPTVSSRAASRWPWEHLDHARRVLGLSADWPLVLETRKHERNTKTRKHEEFETENTKNLQIGFGAWHANLSNEPVSGLRSRCLRPAGRRRASRPRRRGRRAPEPSVQGRRVADAADKCSRRPRRLEFHPGVIGCDHRARHGPGAPSRCAPDHGIRQQREVDPYVGRCTVQ